jgi:SAM-dependent methyltransferase
MVKHPLPSTSKVLDKDFVTYRRFWLDHYLTEFSSDMCGTVVDLGGKRTNKRGGFTPPENQSRNWWYINIDQGTCPNIFGDVTAIPLASSSCDCVLCTEVIEHLTHPTKCVEEMHRILAKDGVAFVSVPFLFPIHADPYDFQRYTEDGLRQLFHKFSSVEIHLMGNYLGVMGLFIELGLGGIEGQIIHRKVARFMLTKLARWLYCKDITPTTQPNIWAKFTTGYFLKAVK